MAVTIDTKKTKEKAEKKARAEAPPEERPANLDDYEIPIVKKNGLIALGIWAGIMVVLCEPWWLKEEVHPIGTVMNLWWFFSTVIYLFVLPGMITRRLRVDGAASELNEASHGRLKALIKKGSGILGIPVPDAYIEKEGSARTFALSGALIFRQGIFDLVTPGELNCLTVRNLMHIRQRHARRMAMMMIFEQANPPILRWLIWPVWIYYSLLKNMWYHHAQLECDRMSMLLIKDGKLMISAIVKEYSHNDENMQELHVTTGDVTNWINQAGTIGMAGEEISTQYKLGRAIHEDPTFEERVQNLQKWAESSEFKVAVQKLAESQKKAG